MLRLTEFPEEIKRAVNLSGNIHVVGMRLVRSMSESKEEWFVDARLYRLDTFGTVSYQMYHGVTSVPAGRGAYLIQWLMVHDLWRDNLNGITSD